MDGGGPGGLYVPAGQCGRCSRASRQADRRPHSSVSPTSRPAAPAPSAPMRPQRPRAAAASPAAAAADTSRAPPLSWSSWECWASRGSTAAFRNTNLATCRGRGKERAVREGWRVVVPEAAELAPGRSCPPVQPTHPSDSRTHQSREQQQRCRRGQAKAGEQSVHSRRHCARGAS